MPRHSPITRTHILASSTSLFLVGLIVVTLPALTPGAAWARSAASAPPLPAPAGTVVRVATVAELQAAVASAVSNSTIVIAPGTYRLTNSNTT